jgi:hypothetical protein
MQDDQAQDRARDQVACQHGTADHAGHAFSRTEPNLLHAELKAMVREISECGTDRLDIETLDALKQWLLAQVLDRDRELARFLQNPAPAT